MRFDPTAIYNAEMFTATLAERLEKLRNECDAGAAPHYIVGEKESLCCLLDNLRRSVEKI